jgi:hypothetical protein
MKFTFVELPVFTKQIDKLGQPLSDDVLSAIEDNLLKDPERGECYPRHERGSEGADRRS